MSVGIVAILCVFGLPVVIVALICGTILILTRRGTSSRQDSERESRLIQEIYHGLQGFEERIASLETLLIDRGKGTGGHE